MFSEEAMQILLEVVASEDNSSVQALAAFVLANLGGMYSWTGESYTAAWLAKKMGLTSVYHRNMFRNIDWFDPCLQVISKHNIQIMLFIIGNQSSYYVKRKDNNVYIFIQ